MDSLEKIVANYSSNLTLLGKGDLSDRTINKAIERLRPELIQYIKTESGRQWRAIVFSIVLMVVAIALLFINGCSDLINNVASICSIVGSPIASAISVYRWKKKLQGKLIKKIIECCKPQAVHSFLTMLKTG